MGTDFAGKTVVVTGGTGALGEALVARLVEGGAKCYVPARDEKSVERSRYRNHPQVTLVPGVDLTSESQVAGLYEKIPSLWASIHVAGGFAMSPLAKTSLDDFHAMMNINAVTCFLCCREAVKRIRAGGGGGRIVNVAARPALVPTGGMIAYTASKAAVAAITTGLAEELAADRIWVNAVVPSIMDTPANRAAMPKADYAKWPKVEEVADTIVFLASPQNAVTRGGLVPVYGQS